MFDWKPSDLVSGVWATASWLFSTPVDPVTALVTRLALLGNTKLIRDQRGDPARGMEEHVVVPINSEGRPTQDSSEKNPQNLSSSAVPEGTRQQDPIVENIAADLAAPESPSSPLPVELTPVSSGFGTCSDTRADNTDTAAHSMNLPNSPEETPSTSTVEQKLPKSICKWKQGQPIYVDLDLLSEMRKESREFKADTWSKDDIEKFVVTEATNKLFKKNSESSTPVASAASGVIPTSIPAGEGADTNPAPSVSNLRAKRVALVRRTSSADNSNSSQGQQLGVRKRSSSADAVKALGDLLKGSQGHRRTSGGLADIMRRRAQELGEESDSPKAATVGQDPTMADVYADINADQKVSTAGDSSPPSKRGVTFGEITIKKFAELPEEEDLVLIAESEDSILTVPASPSEGSRDVDKLKQMRAKPGAHQRRQAASKFKMVGGMVVDSTGRIALLTDRKAKV